MINDTAWLHLLGISTTLPARALLYGCAPACLFSKTDPLSFSNWRRHPFQTPQLHRVILGLQQQLGQTYVASVSTNLIPWVIRKERANIRIPRRQRLARSSQARLRGISS